jgi:F-type H+-transporting ATPase subunit epsilon
MSDKTIRVRVITPAQQVWDGTAVSVQYPGEDGLYGVLPGHAAMITPVAPGIVNLRDAAGHMTELVVAAGFAKVANNEVRLAVDSGEDLEKIDFARAEEAAQRARERLAKGPAADIDLARARYALQRALARLRAKGRID